MQTCPACGQENPDGFRLCGMCGAALAPAATGVREERKVVTILFTDLVGSTARAEGLDPEDVRATLSRYYAQLRAELERYGGTVEKFIGDAVMAVFGAPIAHEDDPERAVRAALAIRDTIGDELQIRTAVNTGEALVALGARPDEGEGMVSGDVVNTAARLQSAAPVNGILVSAATYRATRDVIEYREADPVQAKGKSEPVEVWEAIGARSLLGSDVEEQVRTPLVGRVREHALLTDAFTRARAEQSAQLVTLVGVPGIGKSRLVAELFQDAEADPDLIYWRQGRSLPYGEQVSYWAFGEIVKAHAGILESDDTATAREKLAAMVDSLLADEREREWVTRHVRPLLGLEAAEGAARDEAFAAWRRLLEAAAERGPLVLVFEDLHWADDGLLDFVDHLADWATTVPLLILATARPELLDRRPGWGGGKRNAFTISLASLSDGETAQLLQRLLDRAVIDADVQQAVLQRAEGNPLYAEEYARMLSEHPGEDLPLPESIQGLIAARIDGLAPEEKSLLQDAAVVGKVFWPSSLAAADEQILHSLERKEFVRRDRRSSVAGETQYVFLHALVRDVAYGQIPRAERVEKHRRVAEWIGSQVGDRSEDHAAMLAHHYREALTLSKAAGLDVSSLREPAQRAFAEAARRSLALNSGAAADSLAREALALTEPSDAEWPAMQLLAGYSGYFAGRGIEVVPLLEGAAESFVAAGDPARAAEACSVLVRVFFNTGETQTALENSRRALELARSAPPSVASGWAISGRARLIEIIEADREQAIELSREALGIADEAGDDRLAVHALATLGMARVHAGDPDGIEDLERAAARAYDSGALYEASTTLNNLANSLWCVGRLADGNARLAEMREVLERYGNVDGLLWNDGEQVYAKEHVGDLDAALAAAAYFLSLPASSTSYQSRPIYAARARLHLARGQVENAVSDAEWALNDLRESGHDAQTAQEVLVAASRAFHAAGRADEAEALLTQALGESHLEFHFEVPLHLVELGRGDEYLALTEGVPGHRWLAAGRAAAAGEFAKAAEIYGEIGARFAEAWAGLLAAEHGDASRLDAALAYFEEQRATPYAARCRALMQASA